MNSDACINITVYYTGNEKGIWFSWDDAMENKSFESGGKMELGSATFIDKCTQFV